jgi:hypothetical protein
MDVRVDEIDGRALSRQPPGQRQDRRQVDEPAGARAVAEAEDAQRAVAFLDELAEPAHVVRGALIDEDDHPVAVPRRGAGVVARERSGVRPGGRRVPRRQHEHRPHAHRPGRQARARRTRPP